MGDGDMKKINLLKNGKILIIIGLVLLLGSLGLLLFSQHQMKAGNELAGEVVKKMDSLMPERQAGLIDTDTDVDVDVDSNCQMPILQIDGLDFSGMVEIPEFDVRMPIYSTWDTGKLTSFPCRFYGSAYEGSLIIGGNDQSGQFDCLQKMDLGTAVKIVDMQGAEFSYSVVRIDHSKSADLDILWDAEYDLTMFARYANSKEYVIVRLQMQ